LFTVLACLCLHRSDAQKIVEKHLDFAQKDFVSLNIQIADSIRIITWNKNEVYVKASIDINDNKDNDLYNVDFDESGSTITVKAKFAEHPNRVHNDSCNCNCNYRSKIYCDVYIPANAGFSVETIDGNITITGQTDQVKAHSISGFIDMAVTPERKADLKLRTISGTIYSNLALAAADKGRHSATTDISDVYNGGGKLVDLETISGNIFLRKAE
jgi:DUF4097 and DUF4098 domain-containing protein YvlB